MGSMNLISKLSMVVVMSCLPMLGYSDNSIDFFDALPENTILSFEKTYPDFTQIIIDMPDGQSDTIWIEAQNNTYFDDESDGRREIININTFQLPEIDIESPVYTTQDSEGEIKTIIHDAKYPTDAISKNIQGRVSATCIVEKDGSLSDIIIQEQLCPSINKEAYRLLSQTRLIPCKLGDKAFRCHHRIALSFSLKKDIKDKNNTIETVSIFNVNNIPKGVTKRYNIGYTKNKIEIMYSTSQGKVSKSEHITDKWHSSLEIDIPENNPDLEQVLCQTLFEKGGKSIEETGNKFAKAFEGRIKNKDFKDEEGCELLILAHVLGFKKNKYYSYAYTTKLSSDNIVYGSTCITHNFLYGIQERRILSANDILTQTSLEEISDSLKFEDLKSLEIGMDDYFLYIGREDNIATISLSQDNWNKFTPTMQNILGNKMNLPNSLDEDDFDYPQESNYINELVEPVNGVLIKTFIKKGLRKKREGIQPVGIRKKIIRKPSIGSYESLFHEYLREIWRKNKIQSDSDGFVANISFVLNKNKTISNFQTKLKKGDEKYYQKFLNFISNSPRWKSMLMTIDGAAKNYYNYNVEYGGKVYDYVDKMPEYPGGYPAIFQWISNEINLQKSISSTPIKEGVRIYASCIIEEDGSVSNVRIESPIDNIELKKELERVLTIMPKWNPGKRFGKEVRVRTYFPLKISIVR